MLIIFLNKHNFRSSMISFVGFGAPWFPGSFNRSHGMQPPITGLGTKDGWSGEFTRPWPQRKSVKMCCEDRDLKISVTNSGTSPTNSNRTWNSPRLAVGQFIRIKLRWTITTARLGFKYENPSLKWPSVWEMLLMTQEKDVVQNTSQPTVDTCEKKTKHTVYLFKHLFNRMSPKVMAACLVSSLSPVRKAPLFERHLSFLPRIHWWLHVPRRSYCNDLVMKRSFHPSSKVCG